LDNGGEEAMQPPGTRRSNISIKMKPAPMRDAPEGVQVLAAMNAWIGL
jgi:hypothetical protein